MNRDKTITEGFWRKQGFGWIPKAKEHVGGQGRRSGQRLRGKNGGRNWGRDGGQQAQDGAGQGCRMEDGHVTQIRHRRQSRGVVGLTLPPGAGCLPTGPQRLARCPPSPHSPAPAHLDLGVATVQQADGQANALLEDLLVLGAGDEVTHQLGGPLLVQPALGGCDCRPVLVQAWRQGTRLGRSVEGGEGRAWGELAPQRPGSGDAGLTCAHGVWEVPPRAGLPVLEVILQQHLAKLVALWGRE